MKKVYNKKVRLSCYNNFKKLLYSCKNKQDVRSLEIQYKQFSDCFIGFEQCIELLLKNEYTRLDKQKKEDLIRLPKEFKPLIFNLDGLNELENKINKINNPKLKYEFKGLFNLLSDKLNLTYNSLYERKKIIEDLNKFKSLKFFKINYLSRYNLKNEFKHLTFKNGAELGHSKLYFINKGLYVLKTLDKDNITLKVFYIGNKYKTLLKSSSNVKRTLKGDKFNVSCIDAYKTLNKKDNIRYYTYCNNMGLDKTNRQLLKSIRKSKKLSRDSLIESLEDKQEYLEDSINNKVLSELNKTYYELELEDIKQSLNNLKSYDEDNSIDRETILDDYF